MAVTTYYVSPEGTVGGAGTIGDPMILGGASFTAMLAAETFASNAVRIAFMPGLHTMAAAITPTGTPTIGKPFELVCVNVAGAVLPDPTFANGVSGKWAAVEFDPAYRAQINTSSNLMTGKANTRISGLSFVSTYNGVLSLINISSFGLINNCYITVNAIGATRYVLELSGPDSTGTGVVIEFGTSVTTFGGAIAMGATGVEVSDLLLIGPATTGGTGNRNGIEISASGGRSNVSNCVITRFAGAGVAMNGAACGTSVLNCTIANVGGSGLNVGATPTITLPMRNCHITGCGDYGIDTDAAGPDLTGRMRMRNNTTGDINTANLGDRGSLATLITTAGTDASDFVDAANFDFRLSRGNPAYGTGVGAGDVEGGGGGGGRFPRFTQ